MTINSQNVNRWLTTSADACGSLSQRCQWFSPVTQTKLTKVHFWNSGTGFGFCCSFCWDFSIAPKFDNPVDWGWVNWGH